MDDNFQDTFVSGGTGMLALVIDHYRGRQPPMWEKYMQWFGHRVYSTIGG